MDLDVLNYIIETYEDTIDRLIHTGFGRETEFGTIVTEKLVQNVTDRMIQLKVRRIHLLTNSTPN